MKSKWRMFVKIILDNKKKVIIIAPIVAVIIMICVYIGIKGNNSQEDAAVPTVNEEDMVKDGEFLTIDLTDCSVKTGSQIQAKVTANPEEYASLVNWTSSDENVLSVDANGLITVMSAGTAAVTATAGNLSDSVVITGFTEETPTDELEYPVNNETVAAGVDVSNNNSNPGQSDNNPDSDNSDKETTAAAGNDSTQKNDGEDSEQPESQTPPKEYQQLLDAVEGFGFQVYNADINTYQYIEGETYLGEIMISQDSTHIYIKTRTSSFDEAVRNVLKILLPEQFENVWANYVSAESDITLKSGNDTIVIVPAKNDDHAQIIINY